jgi:hypothetical protein
MSSAFPPALARRDVAGTFEAGVFDASTPQPEKVRVNREHNKADATTPPSNGVANDWVDGPDCESKDGVGSYIAAAQALSRYTDQTKPRPAPDL